MKRSIIGLVCIIGLVVSACYMGGANERVIKLKPGFGEDSFTITFDPAGGLWGGGGDNVPKSITVTVASGIPLPAQTPVRDGYVFNGWFTKQNGGGTAFGAATEITEDATVYAYWMPRPPDPAIVTFNKNGGTYDSSPREKIIEKNTAIADIAELPAAVLPQAPYWEYHHFTGWNTDQNGNGAVFDAATVVSGNLTVYAQWVYQPDSVRYTVIFDSTSADKPAEPGSAIVTAAGGNPLPATLPEKAGYVFSGWYTERDGQGYPFGAITPVKSDTTVYAYWTVKPPDPVRVTFNRNGGHYDASPPVIEIAHGSSITTAKMPQYPYRENYRFSEWNTKANGQGDLFEAATAVTGNITVYAQWIYDQDTARHWVIFESGTVDKPAEPDKVIVAARGGNPMPVSPEKAGYVFSGWNTQADGLGTVFSAATVVTGDTTVYACWTVKPPAPVTVTFDKNGGKYDASPSVIVITYNSTAAAMPTDPYRENYSFNGWNTQANGLGTVFSTATVVSGNITVYAQWVYQPSSIGYTVTFNGDGAEKKAAPEMVIVTAAGGNAMPATLPEKAGYIFGGWYTERDGKGDAFDASYSVTGNLTVYARWIPQNEHSVNITMTFDPNSGTWGDGGTASILIPVTPTSGVPIPAQNLTKAGYYFTGWNTEANGNGDDFGASYSVTKDITVYAQWKTSPSNAVTVTFDKNSGADKAYDASPSVMAVTKNTAVGTLPQAPFREGYDFTGWNTQADGNGSAFTGTTNVSAAVTVYAQWSYNPNFLKYTVAFDGDGADVEANPRFVKVSANGGNTMPATPPQKNGKLFSGWYTQKEGKGTPFSASYSVSADMTVYAWWTDPPIGEVVIITFDKNSTDPKAYDANPRELTISKGETIPQNRMPQDPYWEGHYIKSWNVKADGSGAEFNRFSVVNSNITVYAQWGLSNYTVTFEMNGADSPSISAQTIKHDAKVPEPPLPSKQYFDFAGWYWRRTAPLPDLEWDFSYNTVPGDITLYAKWEHRQPFTDMGRIEEYLKNQKELGKGKEEFDPVAVAVSFDLDKMTEDSSNWQKLLVKLNEKGIYVNLDLSLAGLSKMPGGEFNPVYDATGAVSKGKSYIVSLTLPTAAKKITGSMYREYPSFGDFISMRDVGGAGITEIGPFAFSGPYDSGMKSFNSNSQLRRADFPKVKNIGEFAFAYCVKLSDAIFKNAEEIGNEAFNSCKILSKIDFEILQKIGIQAFYNCTSLTEAKFPALTEIGYRVFGNCTSLTTLRFDSLEELDERVFYGTGIIEIGPESFPRLKKIGKSNFEHCYYLKTVVLNSLEACEDNNFSACFSLETITFASIEKVEAYTFGGINNLAMLNLPQVKEFDDRAFANTGDATLTIIMGNTVPTVGSDMFGYFFSSKTVKVMVPAGALANYNLQWQADFKGGYGEIILTVEPLP